MWWGVIEFVGFVFVCYGMLWSGYDVWCMVYGVWCMVHGAWCMVYGVWIESPSQEELLDLDGDTIPDEV